jgi:hypothetical protein
MTGSATARLVVIVAMLDVAVLGVAKGVNSYTGIGVAPLYGGLVVIWAHVNTGVEMANTVFHILWTDCHVTITKLLDEKKSPNLLQQLAEQNVLFPPAALESIAVISAILYPPGQTPGLCIGVEYF